MKKNGLHINHDGTKIWYKDGLVHREDGPAVIWPDGTEFWYKDDEPYQPSAHELMIWKMNERRRTTH